MANQGVKVLYIDDTCKITNVCIVLKKYYFPLPTSRSILFGDIQRITLASSLHFNQKWGVSVHDMNNWFPYDSKRKNKNLFIACHLKGKSIVPSFTPLDAAKVFTILKQQASAAGLDHIVFQDATSVGENNFEDLEFIGEVEQESQIWNDQLQGSDAEKYYINK